MAATYEETMKRLLRAYDVHDEGALAIQLGRDLQALRVWKHRDAVPLLVLTDASKATGYSLEWLQGEAEATELPTKKRTPDDDANRVALSPREAQLIDRYRNTDEDGRAAVEMVTSTLATGGKVPKARKARAGNPPKGGIHPQEGGTLQMALQVREGDAPWRGPEPVNSDTHKLGGLHVTGRAALLPISSASESRPLVLTIQATDAGQSRDYEVIPKYRATAAAGAPAARDRSDSRGLDQAGDMAFTSTWLRDNLGHTSGQLASIQVQGDSMAPTLHGGETIVIDTNVRRVDVSGIYVIEAHGDRLVKRIDRRLDNSLVIISDNPAYPPETIPANRLDEIRVLGRMVGRWQR